MEVFPKPVQLLEEFYPKLTEREPRISAAIDLCHQKLPREEADRPQSWMLSQLSDLGRRLNVPLGLENHALMSRP